MSNESYTQLFPTHFLKGSFLDYDRINELTTEVLINCALDQGNAREMYRELYNQKASLFSEPDKFPEVCRFKNEFITPAFEEYINKCFNISLKEFKDYYFESWIAGRDHSYHNHTQDHFSAVFYILVDQEHAGGIISFFDPRMNANRGYRVHDHLQKHFDPLMLSPQTGDYVIFPSYLYHVVSTYNGKIRIAMPVDLHLQ